MSQFCGVCHQDYRACRCGEPGQHGRLIVGMDLTAPVTAKTYVDGLTDDLKKRIYERLMTSPSADDLSRQVEWFGTPLTKPMKTYRAANVEFLVDGKRIAVGGVGADFVTSTRRSSDEDRKARRLPDFEISMTMISDKDRLEQIRMLIEAGALTSEQVLESLKKNTIEPLQRPRGSWFAYPEGPIAPEDDSMVSEMAVREAAKNPKIRHDIERWKEDSWARRKQELQDPTVERVKRPKFLSALDVVCASCQHRVHFEAVEGGCKCSKCQAWLWPRGVFDVARLVLRLTGDLEAFQTMLMYPPEDL